MHHMQGACYILAPNGVLDPLPAATDPREVFDQGPLHRIQLKNGWNLLWTSAGYHLAEVNQLASCLARELVKGDACLMHGSSSSTHPAEDLLASWPGQGLNNPRYSWDAWAKALHLPASRSPPASPSGTHHNSSSSSNALCHSPCGRTRRTHRTRTAHAVHARILGRRMMCQAATAPCAAEAAGTPESSGSGGSGGGDPSVPPWSDPVTPGSSLHSGCHESPQQRRAPWLSSTSAAHAAAAAPASGGHALSDRPSVPEDLSSCSGQPPDVCRPCWAPEAAAAACGSGPASSSAVPPFVAPNDCVVTAASGCLSAAANTRSPSTAALGAAGGGFGPGGGGAQVVQACAVAYATMQQAAGVRHSSLWPPAEPQLATAAAGGGGGLTGGAAHAAPSIAAGAAAQVQLAAGDACGCLVHVSSSSSSMEYELSPGSSSGDCRLLAQQSSSSSGDICVDRGTSGCDTLTTHTAAGSVAGAMGASSSSSSSSRTTPTTPTPTTTTSSSRPAGGLSLQELWSSSAAPWEELPPEVLSAIVGHLGRSAAGVLPLYGSSRCWQQAILGDQALLRSLVFEVRDVSAPVRAGHPGAGRTLGAWLRGVGDLPQLLLQAKHAHCVSAAACCAQLLDAAGLPDQAMPCWQRCAKAGHMEGQLRYGLALYRGMAGVVQDAEAAFMYLSRALKQVQGGSSADSSSSSSRGQGDFPLPTGTVGHSSSSSSRMLQTSNTATAKGGERHSGLAAEVLRQAGVVLGYLYFDGEGTRGDREEATRLFKLAADYGSKEAQQVLGWIFNTGQYG